MRSRAVAAADAINRALAALEPGASGRQIADAAASAADAAYDSVADREAGQRDGSVGEEVGSSGSSTGVQVADASMVPVRPQAAGGGWRLPTLVLGLHMKRAHEACT
jgi:minor histocompatibility antigen H13